VSLHADNIVGALQEVSGEIGKIDNQMHQIQERSDETSTAADEMNHYCGDLADMQQHVSQQVDTMNSVVYNGIKSLHQIKKETADIVEKMNNVRSSSEDSYKNLAELESVLEEFKTAEEEIENNLPNQN